MGIFIFSTFIVKDLALLLPREFSRVRVRLISDNYNYRERLCLRGICDFWVNDAIGRPFFVVEKTINPGMIKTLEADIVPRLLVDVPAQPSLETLVENPYLSRFILVFDREGYSPAFFKQMWEKHRISCITYHKYPDDAWPEEWFEEQEVTMPQGEKVSRRSRYSFYDAINRSWNQESPGWSSGL